MTMTVSKAIRDLKHSDPEEHAKYLASGGSDYEVEECPWHLWALVLVAKLHEETEEIRECPTDANEYADLIQVAYALAAHHGVSEQDIREAIKLKTLKWGAFNKRHIGMAR